MNVLLINQVFPFKKQENCLCPLCSLKIKRNILYNHLEKNHDMTIQEFKIMCFEHLKTDKLGIEIIDFYKDHSNFIRGENGICQKFNFDDFFVQSFLSFCGISINKPETYGLELVKSELGLKIIEMYQKHISMKSIAKKLSISYNVVHKVMRHTPYIRKRAQSYQVQCLICKKQINILGLSQHVRSTHNVLYKDYKKIIIDSLGKDKVVELIDDYSNKRMNQESLYKKYNLTLDILKTILQNNQIRIRQRSENLSDNQLWFLFKNEFYQSSWEIRFAWWLESQNLDFITHSKIKPFKYYDSISKKQRDYFPDFFVFEWQEYIEVKGRLDKQTQQKHKDIKDSNPKISVRIFGYEEFIKHNIFKIDKLLNRSIYEYTIFTISRKKQIDLLYENQEKVYSFYKQIKDIRDCHKEIVRYFKIRYEVLYQFQRLYKEKISEIRRLA